MSASVTITVPMTPDSCLSPNARCPRRRRWRAARELRETAGWAATAALLREPFLRVDLPDDGVVMDLDIRWSAGARIKDSDNAIAMCKALRDGIADVLFAGEDKHIRQGTLTQAVTGEGATIVTLRAVSDERAPTRDDRR